MRKGNKKAISSKTLALLLALMMLVGGIVGGTIAWLTDETDEVTNTFTTSDISISLDETERTYQMVPGWVIDKNPTVTVSANSEDCYVFVEITGTNASIIKGDDGIYHLGDYIVYSIGEGWTPLDEEKYPNVFYKIVNEDATADEDTATDETNTADETSDEDVATDETSDEDAVTDEATDETVSTDENAEEATDVE